jgi:hypothetical protein
VAAARSHRLVVHTLEISATLSCCSIVSLAGRCGDGQASHCTAQKLNVTNPYTPPTAASERTSSRRFRVFPAIGVSTGLVCVAIAVGFIYYGFTLRRDYPDLSDPSPNVDAYWPAVVHLIAHIIAGIVCIFGLPILAFSLYRFVKRG